MLAGKIVAFIYIDNDGDEIAITNETEFREAVCCMSNG